MTASRVNFHADVRLCQRNLARRWDVSPRTLEKWRTLGVGPAYIKIGGRVRYLLEHVLAYETENRRGGRR